MIFSSISPAECCFVLLYKLRFKLILRSRGTAIQLLRRWFSLFFGCVRFCCFLSPCYVTIVISAVTKLVVKPVFQYFAPISLKTDFKSLMSPHQAVTEALVIFIFSFFAARTSELPLNFGTFLTSKMIFLFYAILLNHIFIEFYKIKSVNCKC